MSGPITTGCQSVDSLLGGGFSRKTVTQLYGPPAAGKTNIALSAAVATAATGGRALYIDTEGLSIDRFEQLLRGHTTDAETVERLSTRISISDVLTFAEQKEAVKDAKEQAETLDLIVLDSATGLYRLERSENDSASTLRAIGRQVTHLLGLARQHELAVCITNQVFADPDSDTTRPLGGNTLMHWSGAVLKLERFRGGNRRATLEKHRSKPAGENCTFQITTTGLESGSTI